MYGKWNVSQVTLQQMFKVAIFCTDTCLLPVFFATDQLYRPPRCAEIQPMSQQDASATRLIADTYPRYRRVDTGEKMKNMKNVCFLQGNAVTFFRCGG